jgi:DNA-binding NtrC family response regulator
MKHSILIVDDESCIREGMKCFLSQNYTTHEASNGKEAIEILRENPDIEVILSDITMPEMEGIEMLEKIRAENNNTIVIFLTAIFSIESRVDAMRKGAYDYLTKPVDLNKLEITIKNAFLETIKPIENKAFIGNL